MQSSPLLSVIIPTWNEAQTLTSTLQAVARLKGLIEVLVVDGGSLDGTAGLAGGQGVRVLISRRGRGMQQHMGAQVAQGDVLWFLHADTMPPADAVLQIRARLQDPRVIGGHFTLRFEGQETAARFLTWLYPHLNRFGLRYGDSALFVRRWAYWRAGGFRPLPLFEDLDLIARLQQHGRFVRLPAVVGTSARRFRGRSFAGVFLRWVVLQVLYWLGVSPSWLGRHYAPVREVAEPSRPQETDCCPRALLPGQQT